MGRVIGVENQRGGSPVTSRVSRVAIKSQRSVAVDDDGGGGRTAAMKYAARIHCVGDISRVIVRLSRYDWSPGKGRTTAVNTRIIKRTNYRACARTIPKSYTDGVGNHLLRARFPRRIFREIETATADGVDFFRSTRYAHGSLTYESNERGRHSRASTHRKPVELIGKFGTLVYDKKWAARSTSVFAIVSQKLNNRFARFAGSFRHFVSV